jgi:cyclophilin family peptidyl-prolyl cis-trans isomerase
LIATGRLEERRLAVRALGQVGEQPHVAALTQLLYAEDPALVGTAARALGVMGRRKLALDEIPTGALRLAAKSDPWGAGYLLANLTKPRDEDVALAREVAGRAEARWIALRGLLVVEPDLARQLDDPSPVVRVEAVRLLAGKKATPAARRALVAWVREAWAVPANRRPPAAHPVLEALRLLEPQTLDEPQIAELFLELAVPTGGTPEERRVLDEVACLRASAAVRGGGPYAPLLACGEPSGRGWPIFKRRELVLALIDGGRGSDAERASAMEAMWNDKDPRVRGLGAAAAVKLNRFDIAARALQEQSIVIAGPAVDELATKGKAKPLPAQIETALLVRAEAGLDTDEPELLIGLLDALGTSTDPRAATVRARAARSGIEAVRKAANATPDRFVFDPPSGMKVPAPSRTVRGAGWRLKVSTSRGVFHIDLDPTIAPVAVSALVTLAERRFYDGLIFHRVVPNFVVQGGDPTGSGWGGAGFLLPSERSTLRYLRGTVGLADSGLDTAGSQWFVTLEESPHLEGRYTIIGHVPEAEMKVVDQLLVGDVMTRVEVIAP